MSEFPVQDGATFLLIGDSITDCGRRGGEMPLGSGYVRNFVEIVTARHPERRIAWINKGIGGNTILDLSERWADDVIREKPNWLSVKIGINDLHGHLRGGEHGVSPERFRELYTRILTEAKEAFDHELVLIDPFYISNQPSAESLRAQVLALLPEYLGVVEELAGTFGARRLQTHELYARHLAYRESEVFCPEPVHPNRTGHFLIADALYDLICG